MKYKLLKIIFVLLLISIASLSQQHSIRSYNLLNYPGLTGAIQNQHFITVLSNTEPDIIVAQESISQGSVNEFVSNVLMQISMGVITAGNIRSENEHYIKSNQQTFIQ